MSNNVDQADRLAAAVAAIHNHLHAGDVNAAHAACECAMAGGEVAQPNLTLPQTARAQRFAVRFNELCAELDIEAGFLALLPSASLAGATSLQVGGCVRPTRVIESAVTGGESVYQGEHPAART